MNENPEDYDCPPCSICGYQETANYCYDGEGYARNLCKRCANKAYPDRLEYRLCGLCNRLHHVGYLAPIADGREICEDCRQMYCGPCPICGDWITDDQTAYDLRTGMESCYSCLYGGVVRVPYLPLPRGQRAYYNTSRHYPDRAGNEIVGLSEWLQIQFSEAENLERALHVAKGSLGHMAWAEDLTTKIMPLLTFMLIREE